MKTLQIYLDEVQARLGDKYLRNRSERDVTDLATLLDIVRIQCAALEELEQLERGHEIYEIGSADEPRAHRVAREALAQVNARVGGSE